MRLIYIFILVFASISSLRGQGTSLFNLNEENGLPSNRVYSIITDRHGYLWIATDKGVVKYNGYECKLFDKTNGLPNDDVWQLLEDKKGRIWLGSIAEKIGYILNDKYHDAPLKNFRGTIFPRSIRLRDSGITLFNVNIQNKISIVNYIERDDTLFPFYLHDSIFAKGKNARPPFPIAIHNSEGVPYCTYYNRICKIAFDANDKTGKCSVLSYSTFPPEETLFYQNEICYLIGNKIVMVKTEQKWPSISITNVDDAKRTEITVADNIDEYVNHVCFKEKKEETNTFYIISKSAIKKCTLHDTFEIINSKKISDYISDLDGQYISCIYENGKWGYCIGTTNNGVYLINEAPVFAPSPISIPSHTYIGGNSNKSAFWWSSKDNELAYITKDNCIKTKLNNIRSIKSIRHKANDEYLISSVYLWNFSAKTGKMTKLGFEKYGGGFTDTWFRTDSDFYATSNHGLYYVKTRNGNSVRKYADHNKFLGIEYDSIRKCNWAFNQSEIVKILQDSFLFLKKNELERYQIREIESLLSDPSYGNIIIKSGNRLLLFDPEGKKSLTIFSDILIKEKAYVGLNKNVLTVAWRYGLLFAKLTGKMQISKPILFLNYKNIKYKNIYGACVINDKLQINTDKGYFQVDIPDFKLPDTAKSELTINSVIVANGGLINKYVSGDTVIMNDSNRNVIFDIIKPTGSGIPKYYYSFDSKSAKNLLNSNELDIPTTFKPDEYHSLTLDITDNISKSENITLYLYITPKWWQTKVARKLIVVFSVILVIIIIFFIVFITRKAVLKASYKKQLQMELELKAIYAQINPHFIFNTLTSALLLVSKNRMDEAYAHISKFSKLLRSYLKSSRNKFITLADEIDNLKNYTELQQTRFKNRFVCDIIVDSRLNAEQVNIPSLLLQPFVENAINHGILSSDKPGKLLIEFIRISGEHKIVCVISDNGIGRQKSIEDKKRQEHSLGSYGNMMIKDLVGIFNKYEEMNIEIEYEDKEYPESGTSVIITITYPDNKKGKLK